MGSPFEWFMFITFSFILPLAVIIGIIYIIRLLCKTFLQAQEIKYGKKKDK